MLVVSVYCEHTHFKMTGNITFFSLRYVDMNFMAHVTMELSVSNFHQAH